MIARLLSFDVGINPYCVRKKEWVQLASAAIGAVGSLRCSISEEGEEGGVGVSSEAEQGGSLVSASLQ